MKNLIFSSCLALSLIVIGGCTGLPKDSSIEIEKPEVPKAIASIALPWGERKEWTSHLMKEVRLNTGLLKANPADMGDWCPNYSKLSMEDRAIFYATLIAEAARWESNFKPQTSTYECQKASCVYGTCRYVEDRGFCMVGGHKLDGGLVISRGLMQMSLQSAQGLGCDVSDPSDLNDPLKNLSCTVKGFGRYIPNGGQIATKVGSSWKGAAAYWAVFRGTNDYTKKARAAINAAGKKFCASKS